jgi:uncharacterized protein DUF742
MTAEHDGGPLVRPYTITRGRIRTGAYQLDLVTIVVALRDTVRMVDAEPEHTRILALCRRPVSVAEVAARTNLPLSVVKVLLADLIEHRHLVHRTPAGPVGARDPHVLQAVLDGIRGI